MSLPDELVRLRLAVWANQPEYQLATAAPAVHRTVVEHLDAAEEVRIFGSPLRAAVVLSRLPSNVLVDAQRCLVECQPNDAAALQWTKETLCELSPTFDPTFVLTLEHAEIVPALDECRLRARMRHYHGDPARALSALRPPPLPAGLRIEPLGEEEHVEPVVTLTRDVFGAEPELGYISPDIPLTPDVQERLDAFVRAGLVGALGDETHFLVLEGERVVGHAGLHLRADDPLFGCSAGLSITLHASIRGRGVGTHLYATLAERMVELGVRVMGGKTANPAVVHLAERMGRVARAFHVESFTSAIKRAQPRLGRAR